MKSSSSERFKVKHFCAVLIEQTMCSFSTSSSASWLEMKCQDGWQRASHLNCLSILLFDFLMHTIRLMMAVNMRDANQVGLPKQAAPGQINTLLGPLCLLFCLYTTHVSTLVFVRGSCKGMDKNHGTRTEAHENRDLKWWNHVWLTLILRPSA